MGEFFNTTRGPLAATLLDKSSCSIPPKKWVTIPADQENSASIVRLVEKGFLVRSKVSSEPVVVPPVPETPKAEVPKVDVAPVPEPKDSAIEPKDAGTSPLKEEFPKKKK